MANLEKTALWRRLLYFALVLGSTLAAASMMVEVLRANGLHSIELAISVLFTISFAWIATSFWTATAGFLVRLGGGDPASLDAAPDQPLTTRTALAMPIYNEDVRRVFAGVEATWRSLEQTGEAAAFDFFILSDTTDPAKAAQEEAAWADLARRAPGGDRIHYRRRAANTGRKAGNIADFIRQWGSRYDHMLVLDADSVMGGETVVRLARLMQANPGTGIIQTLPMPANAETLFGRLLQFASRLYGPVLASGLSWWQLGEGNYWGHNAIIRVRAFASHCALPVLPGKAPLGGEVLSHDFVEAAFIRAAGWQVWMVPDLSGSWEELPPNVIDYAKRDRRWCQGNLQHMMLLPSRGLHPLSRLHLVMGVMGYAASPIWFLMLLLATIDVTSLAIQGHPYFLPGYNLFPNWPIAKTAEIVSLLSVTAAVLLLPRIYSLLLVLADGRERRAFGGARRLLPSALLELFHSMLLAPSMMIFHVHFVLATLLGHKVTWNAQTRSGHGLPLREAAVRHGFQVALGLAWGGTVYALAPDFLYWMMPVLVGLVGSIGLSYLSSRSDLGAWSRRRGLFLTPEEVSPPAELALARTLADRPLPADATALPALPEPSPLPMAMHRDLDYWSPHGLLRPTGRLGRVGLSSVAALLFNLHGPR